MVSGDDMGAYSESVPSPRNNCLPCGNHARPRIGDVEEISQDVHVRRPASLRIDIRPFERPKNERAPRIDPEHLGAPKLLRIRQMHIGYKANGHVTP